MYIINCLQNSVISSDRAGRFILTGSNNFLLQENISQSLAGRVGYLFLLPFTCSELKLESDLNTILLKGLYPPVYSQNIDFDKWYLNYIRTYIERDVRQIKNITNLYLFEKFIRLSAGRVGQLLNMRSLAIETGVDSKTIAACIGILEASFFVFRLQPYYVNFNKRVVKMPKLYFYDTGIVCSLLGIKDKQQLSLHHSRGSIFENFVVTELIKKSYNKAEPHNLFFWRDNTGNEIDLIYADGSSKTAVEIKSGKTITNEYFRNINFWQKISGEKNGKIIYAGDNVQQRSNGIAVLTWTKINEI